MPLVGELVRCQIELFTGSIEVTDHIGVGRDVSSSGVGNGRTGNIELVRTCTASEDFCSSGICTTCNAIDTGQQNIITVTTRQGVLTSATSKAIVASITCQAIITGQTEDLIGPCATREDVTSGGIRRQARSAAAESCGVLD